MKPKYHVIPPYVVGTNWVINEMRAYAMTAENQTIGNPDGFAKKTAIHEGGACQDWLVVVPRTIEEIY